MVFNVELYTDKAHEAMKLLFSTQKYIAHTLRNVTDFVSKTVGLIPDNDAREATLNKVIKTGLTKLEQLGLIDKVHHRMNQERMWMNHDSVAESAYTSITNDEKRAKSEKAKKKVAKRALNIHDLYHLNKL